MARRRLRRTQGVIPRAGRALWWLVVHPQLAAVLIIAVACTVGVWEVARRSEAFQVTQLQVPPTSALKLPESLIGRNLWTVDLTALATQLHAQRPSLKRIRVIRRLPNTLQVEILERAPVAQLRLGQWHPVDGEGYILPESRPTPWERVVILRGVESAVAPLHAGRENPSERLRLALRLVAQLRRTPAMVGRRLTAVDVSDPQQLNFVIDDAMEVRCGGEEHLRQHLSRLHAVLQRVARQQLAVRYIDVRFQEPVIGPRT